MQMPMLEWLKFRGLDASNVGCSYVGSAKIPGEQDRAEKAAADALLHDELPAAHESRGDASERRPAAPRRRGRLLERAARSVRSAGSAAGRADAPPLTL